MNNNSSLTVWITERYILRFSKPNINSFNRLKYTNVYLSKEARVSIALADEEVEEKEEEEDDDEEEELQTEINK